MQMYTTISHAYDKQRVTEEEVSRMLSFYHDLASYRYIRMRYTVDTALAIGYS